MRSAQISGNIIFRSPTPAGVFTALHVLSIPPSPAPLIPSRAENLLPSYGWVAHPRVGSTHMKVQRDWRLNVFSSLIDAFMKVLLTRNEFHKDRDRCN